MIYTNGCMETNEEIKVLRELFDEKIIKIIRLFLESPNKEFYLTEISNKASVNISTTSRILKNLSQSDFIETTIMGKAKFYQLAKNRKTQILRRFLKKNEVDPVDRFIDKIKEFSRLKKVVLETRNKDKAKVLIIGEFFPENRLRRICQEIKDQFGFTINFIRISEGQFEGLKEIKNYSLDKKIIWEREE